MHESVKINDIEIDEICAKDLINCIDQLNSIVIYDLDKNINLKDAEATLMDKIVLIGDSLSKISEFGHLFKRTKLIYWEDTTHLPELYESHKDSNVSIDNLIIPLYDLDAFWENIIVSNLPNGGNSLSCVVDENFKVTNEMLKKINQIGFRSVTINFSEKSNKNYDIINWISQLSSLKSITIGSNIKNNILLKFSNAFVEIKEHDRSLTFEWKHACVRVSLGEIYCLPKILKNNLNIKSNTKDVIAIQFNNLVIFDDIKIVDEKEHISFIDF